MPDFAELGIELPPGAAGEVDVLCPWCAPDHRVRKLTLSVNVESGVYLCHRCGSKGRTGSRGSRRDVATRIRTESGQRTLEQRRTAKRARDLWDKAEPAIFHPYLARKRVLPFGLCRDGDALLVPMVDIRTGMLWNIQRIRPDGTKRWLKGGRVTGLMHIIQRRDDCADRTLHVCEGYATGASLHQRFFPGAAVAIAFCAGNLEPVALELHAAFPRTEIVLCADDDALTPGNPGMTKAREAAEAIGGGRVLRPDFGPERRDTQTDFNDLHQLLLEREEAGRE